MKLWKKNPAPQPHHDNTRSEIASLKARITQLEQLFIAQQQPNIYKLDPNEDVLVQCLINVSERVSVPLSLLSSSIQQSMLASLTVNNTPRRSRSAKLTKPVQPEGEQ